MLRIQRFPESICFQKNMKGMVITMKTRLLKPLALLLASILILSSFVMTVSAENQKSVLRTEAEAKEYIESIWNCLNEESKQILAEAEELLNHGNQTICTVILRIKNQFSQGSLIDINNDIQKRLTPLIHTNSADETLNNTYITLFRGGNEHV